MWYTTTVLVYYNVKSDIRQIKTEKLYLTFINFMNKMLPDLSTDVRNPREDSGRCRTYVIKLNMLHVH